MHRFARALHPRTASAMLRNVARDASEHAWPAETPAPPAHRRDRAALDDPSRRAEHRRAILYPSLLVVLTLAAYVPAMMGGFIWDDDSYVTGNRLLRDVEGLRRIWTEPRASPQYYPLVFTTFWLEHRLWGLHPFGYHTVNILLHSASVLLLYRLLRRLAVPGALFAAAVFAVHPVHVESVAWITERKNVLSGFFYLAAALYYLRFAGVLAPRPAPSGTDAPRAVARDYAAAFVLFLCALLSKTVTCTFPAAMLVVIWFRRGRVSRRDLLAAAPFLAVGACMGLVTAWLERTHVGAEQIDWRLSPVDRVLIAGRALWFYLGKLALPARLAFFYPRWTPDVSLVWQYLFPAGWLALLAILWRLHRRVGRGPLAAMLLFTGTLVPALGFVDVFPFRYSFVADHFQYLASIGPIVLLCAAAAVSLRPAARAVCAAGVVAALAALTCARCVAFMDVETLWRDTLAKNESSWAAHQNLGVLLDRRGETAEAVRHFERAVELNPDEYQIHMNLSIARFRQGDIEAALASARRAVRLAPASAMAEYNVGVLLAEARRDDEAVAAFRRAVTKNPRLATARHNLGILLDRAGATDEALVELRRAVELDPELRPAWLRLADFLRRTDRAAEAGDVLKRAALRFPNDGEIRALIEQHSRRDSTTKPTVP